LSFYEGVGVGLLKIEESESEVLKIEESESEVLKIEESESELEVLKIEESESESEVLKIEESESELEVLKIEESESELEVLKIEESESELLCTDSTALILTLLRRQKEVMRPLIRDKRFDTVLMNDNPLCFIGGRWALTNMSTF
jgi:hypothetical protein